MSDVFIAPKLWLPNISDFNDVYYRTGQYYESGSINSLFEMSPSWGDVWLTPGQAFSRRSLIKRLISGDLCWWHELGQEADSLNIWYNVSLLHCIVGSYVFILYMMFHWMFETIMMTFKLSWCNRRWLWHMYICQFSQGITKIPSREIVDFNIILFQIYHGIGVPIIIFYFTKVWQSYCENKMVQFFASQCSITSASCLCICCATQLKWQFYSSLTGL